MSLRVGIVAGEASGDLLAAGLIAAIKARHPEAQFVGIAGPRMVAQGCQAIHPAEKLAVMGLVEVLGHLRELHAIRRDLIARFTADPPDVFIGVDAPDFNLGLELKLKRAGIRTVHYVSPSVWAWRRYRVAKIARATDLMLTLFPFETQFYTDHQVNARFVGHPLADAIPLDIDKRAARTRLDLPADGELIALLPGSRLSEVRALGDLLLRAAAVCHVQRPGVRFAVPLATSATKALFESQCADLGVNLPITLFDGQAQDVMAAADAVMLASGTATLEALLVNCPPVIAYRLAPLTFWLAKRLVKVPYYSLPNLLADRALVPEFIQDDATPENLAQAVLTYLQDPSATQALTEVFSGIHRQLRLDADRNAAAAVLDLIAH